MSVEPAATSAREQTTTALPTRIRSMSRAEPCVDVRWWPLQFRLYSTEPYVLRWFHHHLHSVAALMGAEQLAPVSIHAVVDGGLTGEVLYALMNGQTASVEGYVGDIWTTGTVAGMPAWSHGTPPDRSDTAHVLVAVSPREWLVAGSRASTVATATVRACRELIRTELARRDAYTLHASLATGPKSGGMLFVGPTGAGKTTIALAAARAGGYLVSGDQTELVVPTSGEPFGVGFPWVARLGFGTLAQIGVDRAIESTPLLRHQPAMANGRVVPEARTYRSPTKIELTMLELDALLAVPPVDRATVDAVVMIKAADSNRRPQAESATVAAVVDDLREAFREPDPAFAGFWLAAPAQRPSDRRPFEALCGSLQRTPVVRLTWNPERDGTAEALAAVHAALGPRLGQGMH
jgi:hypothetical protein